MGDGKTDNFGAFQNALNAAQAGGIGESQYSSTHNNYDIGIPDVVKSTTLTIESMDIYTNM